MDDDSFGLMVRPNRAAEASDFAFPAQLRRAVADLILETTAESIWLIDAQARTTFVNRRMADLLGYTEEEMIGRPVFDFLDPSDWSTAAENLKKRESGLEDRREVQLTRKDGTRVWILGSANPVFDRHGRYAGALAVLGDLTEQKKRECLLKTEPPEDLLPLDSPEAVAWDRAHRRKRIELAIALAALVAFGAMFVEFCRILTR